MKYEHARIDKKWQDRWEEAKIFEASEDHSKKKFYSLVEFPYPSGSGMHVGHIKAYSGLDGAPSVPDIWSSWLDNGRFCPGSAR